VVAAAAAAAAAATAARQAQQLLLLVLLLLLAAMVLRLLQSWSFQSSELRGDYSGVICLFGKLCCTVCVPGECKLLLA
jgi:hypothetical protein